MINTNMCIYDYYLYEDKNGYGQPTLSKDVKGTIKMSVFTTNQNTQDNINYEGAKYIGLTHAKVTDKFVIKYGEEKLKVLYVQPKGRYKQVFMGNM